MKRGLLVATVKIHKIGGSLMVVLPSSWCFGMHINEGDTMDGRFLNSGELLLSPKLEGKNE